MDGREKGCPLDANEIQFCKDCKKLICCFQELISFDSVLKKALKSRHICPIKDLVNIPDIFFCLTVISHVKFMLPYNNNNN